jgi:putative sterol carrier protein
MGFMDELKDSIEAYLKSGFPADKGFNSNYDRVVQLNIAGDTNFYMEIKGGRELIIREGSHSKPDVTIISDKNTMMSMKGGELGALQAFTEGKLKVKGSLLELFKLQTLVFYGDGRRGSGKPAH